MTQYLVAIYRPENYAPAVSEDEAMGREIDALNDEMNAAGVRVFAGGLQPESSATSLRLQPAGKVRITDGPYAETKDIVVGYSVVRAKDYDEAVALTDGHPIFEQDGMIEIRPVFKMEA